MNKGILRVPLVGLLTFSLVMAGGLFYVFTAKVAHAGAVTAFKDTLSTAVPSTAANHTISFTLNASTNWDAGDTLTIQLDATGKLFNLSALANTDPLDYDIYTAGATEESVVAAGGCASNDAIEITSIDTGTDTITFTACSSYTAPGAGSTVVIEIGTNATSPSAGDSQITNPAKVAAEGTADTYMVDLAGTIGDTGTTMAAIIDGVAVSVTVDETLSFTIAGVDSGSCTGDSGTPTVRTTTAATVPFSTVNTEAFYAGCQTLTVTTNASDGYSVAAASNTSLKSAASDLIDSGTCDGTCTKDTGGAWATATNNGLAFYCDEGTGSPCADAGDSNTEYRIFACSGANADCDPGSGGESTVAVMSETVPASGDVGTIHYKISVSGTQPAGTYSNTVTYVATPTF